MENRRLLHLGCSAALLMCAGAPALAQTFDGIGFLPGYPGPNTSAAYDVTDSGLVVGSSGSAQANGNYGAIRWTRAGGLVALPAPDPRSTAVGLSADGSVAVGYVGASDGGPFIWNGSSGQYLPLLPGATSAWAMRVSADGTIVAGNAITNNHTTQVGFRWSAADGYVSFNAIPGWPAADVQGMSADGSVLVGDCQRQQSSAYQFSAFRWTASQGIAALFADQARSGANAVSADGSVVVGWHSSTAFKWTQAGGAQVLPALPGDVSANARRVDANGSVIVGTSTTPAGHVRAVIWSPALGVVSFDDYLPTLGINLSGWTLDGASGISPDGHMICGSGTHNGLTEGWVVNIPANLSCGSADFNHDGDYGTDTDIEAFFACLGGNCCAACGSADFNSDGDIGTDADIEAFFRVLGGGSC